MNPPKYNWPFKNPETLKSIMSGQFISPLKIYFTPIILIALCSLIVLGRIHN